MSWPPNAGARRGRPPIEKPVIVFAAIAFFVVVVAWQQGIIGIEGLLLLVAFVPSVILHEVSHGAIAKLYGDDTARDAGRLTLNPLRHMDLWGTFVIPAVLLISTQGAFAFGYAKPVPVNTTHMTRNQTMFTGLVGPLVNIVIALLVAVVFIAFPALLSDGLGVDDVLIAFGYVNVLLAVFNALPIPPLDGAAVIERFLPARYWPQYLKFRQYSVFIRLFIMILLSGELYDYVLRPALSTWVNLFL